MDGIRTDLGMVGIIDIVLNHTASNSEWIREHPESGFSLENTPRLWPAWLLDKALSDISEELSQGGVTWCPSAPYIRTEEDLVCVVDQMHLRAKGLKLHEFFQISFDKTRFMKEIQGIPKNVVVKLLDKFEKQGLNQMDHFQVLED